MRFERFIRLSVLCGFLLLLPLNAPAADKTAGKQVKELSDEITSLTFGSGKTVLDPQRGYARFVGTDKQRPIPVKGVPPGSPSEKTARAFLDEYGRMFGVADQATELVTSRVKEADQGRSFVRFKQVLRGVPVFGGEIVVQVLASGEVLSANGKLLPGAAIDTTPVVGSEYAVREALALVSKHYGIERQALSSSQPELRVYNPTLFAPGRDVDSLVWLVEVTPTDVQLPIREIVLVDAHAGFVALNFNQAPHALNREVYTKNNVVSNTLPGTLVRSEGQGATGDADVDKAYDYSGDTYDFYLTRHGRDSIDNGGMTLISTVKFCPTGEPCPYPNAFWNGAQMVYGAGFAAADDVVAHELTHGVTEWESGLFYYYQSGAINESLSDLWGEFVDLSNGSGTDTPAVRWLMGEDLSIGAIRSMSDPTAYGDPDKMTSSNYWCSSSDGGGVHSNSGVNNKAAYLMVDGGTFNSIAVAGIGITKAAKIYYEAQSNLLVSASDYLDLYSALQQACANLTGTAGISASNCQQVKNALDAVEMSLQPTSCATLEAPVCDAGLTPVDLFFDDMENPSSGNWLSVVAAGSTQWVYVGEYATSGVHSLWAEDKSTVTDFSAVMAAAVPLPSGSDPVHLRFNHIYDMEGGATAGYDGGVVEYSLNGGATWSDAGSLFTENGYNRTLSAGYSNPLAGRQAFSSVSYGYLSSRLNLAALAGSSVKFRFRVGTDTSVADLGWLLDDVRIYRCVAAAVAPTLGTLTPSAPTSASGVPRSFAAVYRDENGNADLKIMDFLVSSDSGAVNAIWARYRRDVNRLYLWNDARTAMVGSCIPGTARTLSNSQGALNCATTTAIGAGNDFTVNWNITPTLAFSSATPRKLLMAAQDVGGLKSGWRNKGGWTITPGNEAPTLGTLTPSAPTSASGVPRSFAAVYRDENGNADLKIMDFLVSPGTGAVNAIWARYRRDLNRLYLWNDAKTAMVGSCIPGTARTLSNSQGTLNCATTTAIGAGNDFTVNWNITPTLAFSSPTPRKLLMAVQDVGGLKSGWRTKGTWTITAP